MRLQAHSALGATLFFQGRLNAARPHLQRAIELYEPKRHQEHAFLYGVDPGLLAMVFEVWRLWYHGFPDQALRYSDRVLEVARASEIPFSLADPLVFRAELHQLRREPAAAQQWAEAVIELASEQGFPYWQARGRVLRGWALARRGSNDEGIELLRQGLADYQATGAKVMRPYFLGLFAEVLFENGKRKEAEASLEEALELVGSTGEGYFAPELHRLKGLCLMAYGTEGTQSLAAKAFQQSLELARREGALIFELRVLQDLATLHRDNGTSQPWLEMLAKVLDRFPEGAGTKDLQEARLACQRLER